MFKRASYTVVVLLIGIVLGMTLQPLASTMSYAQPGCQTFKETNKTVCGRFLEYWQKNGGLAQQGLPLSGEFTEVSDLNGQSYTVQYFERSVFEKHPENAAPYDVLLSQLGTFQFKKKYPGGEPGGGSVPTAQPQPTAASGPSINGQTVEFPGFLGKGTFRGTVTDVKEAQTIPPFSGADGGTARGKFVLVTMTVTNTGTESQSTGRFNLKLRDSKGRNFDITDNFEVWYAAVKAAGTPVYTDNIQPGLPTKMLFVFDVATDAIGYYLIGVK